MPPWRPTNMAIEDHLGDSIKNLDPNLFSSGDGQLSADEEARMTRFTYVSEMPPSSDVSDDFHI